MSNRKLIPLIDADILVYRLGFAADARAKKTWPETFMQRDYKNDVFNLIDVTVDRIINNNFSAASESYLYLTGKHNFRDAIATLRPYKGNRKLTPKPKYYKDIRDYMVGIYGAQVIDGMEADDALGIAQCEDPDNTSIVSIDKDLDMIPGNHHNFVKDTAYYVTKDQGYINFFRQLLQGDSTDNIPGIPGLGPVKSLGLLPDGTSTARAKEIVDERYYEEYEEKAEEYLSELSNLIWIRRKKDEWCPFYEPPQVKAKEDLKGGPPQVEDQDAIGESSSEVGVREESTD